jgi:hypothetical protein
MVGCARPDVNPGSFPEQIRSLQWPGRAGRFRGPSCAGSAPAGSPQRPLRRGRGGPNGAGRRTHVGVHQPDCAPLCPWDRTDRADPRVTTRIVAGVPGRQYWTEACGP